MDDPARVGRLHGTGQDRHEFRGRWPGIGVPAKFRVRLPPSISSIVKYGRPSASPTS